MNLKKGMKILNNQFDQQVKRAIRHTERNENLRVQCRQGCNYCCNLLVMATVSEAIVIVDHLGFDRLRELTPALVADCKELANPATTLVGWSRRWKPCHVLQNGLCGAYEQRPLSCRSHVSFQAPALCDDPDGVGLSLGVAHHLCAAMTQHFRKCDMPTAMAPLQYQLLLILYVEEHEDSKGEWERLQNTSALDFEKSVVAWQHLMESPIKPEHKDKLPAHAPIVPVWEYFDSTSPRISVDIARSAV